MGAGESGDRNESARLRGRAREDRCSLLLCGVPSYGPFHSLRVSWVRAYEWADVKQLIL